jgi:hypothetical protein
MTPHTGAIIPTLRHASTRLPRRLVQRPVLGVAVDPYSTLQLIDDVFRLKRLRGAACLGAATLQPLLCR